MLGRRYSNFAEDLETIVCFLDFQEINESLKNMQKLVIEHQVSRRVPQFSINGQHLNMN